MTPNQVAAAYKAVHELTSIIFPYKTARSIAALKSKLESEFETITKMREALIKECGGEDQGDTIHFVDNTAATAFYDKYKSLMAEDAEIDLPKIDLSRYADNIRISPDAISALDGIITFEKE